MSKKRKSETDNSVVCGDPNGCTLTSCKGLGECIYNRDKPSVLDSILEASEPEVVVSELPPVPFPKKFDNETGEDIPDAPIERPNVLHAHRESWLHDVAQRLTGHLFEPEFSVPTNIRISCGFPSRNGLLGGKMLRSGECWGEERSADGHFEIFISPVIDDPLNVIGVLGHEMCHAVAGIAAKHGPDFKKVASHIGLEGKMTATTIGVEFKNYALDIIEAIGPYPMAKLDARKMSNGIKKQGTRLLKAECASCGYTVRISQKWVDEVGTPHCPMHGEMYMEDKPDPDISE